MSPFPTSAAPENSRCLLFLLRLLFRRRFLCTSLALCTALAPPLRAVSISRMYPHVTHHIELGGFLGDARSVHFNSNADSPYSIREEATTQLRTTPHFFFPTKAIDQRKQPRVWRERESRRVCCATPLCDPHACYRATGWMDRDCDDDAQSKRKKTNHRSLLPGVFEKTQEV